MITKMVIALAFMVLAATSGFHDWFSKSEEDDKQGVFVCQLSFKEEQYNNRHAGSGFFIQYNGQNYGVTAKHILLFAKTDKMDSIDFGDELESFEFVSPADSTLRIKADRLINANPDEKLGNTFLGDWLIFEIEEDLPESVKVFEISSTLPQQGDYLSFKGFPYQSDTPSVPLKVEGSFTKMLDEYTFDMKVPKGNYGGCSGGPVTDQNGKVVGLVSMGYFDQNTQQQVFLPASIAYFIDVINNQ